MKINRMNRAQIREKLHALAQDGQAAETDSGFVGYSDFARRLVERFYELRPQTPTRASGQVHADERRLEAA